MLTLKKLLVCLLVIMAVVGLSGCDEGPMERTGKAIDEAVEDTGEALEDAQEKVEDAIEDQKEKNK
jgi:hypothetical protein